MTVHLCTCGSGPHADMPVTVLDPGTVLVMRDPNHTVTADSAKAMLGPWIEDRSVLVVIAHDADMRLESLSDADLDSIGLMRRASAPLGEPPEADDGG